MAIIRAVIRKEPREDGTWPIALRINKGGKVSHIYLDGYAVKPGDWDKKGQCVKKSNPSHARLNAYILKKRTDAVNKTLELETDKSHVTIKQVRNKIKPKTGSTFAPVALAYLESLKAAGDYNQYTAEKPRVNRFIEFSQNAQDVSFNDISQGYMENYITWLKKIRWTSNKGEEKKLGDRTIINHLSTVRSVYAYARKHQVIDDKTPTPFGKGKISIRFPDSNKVGLNAEELHSLEIVELPDPRHHHARNLWLFSFYFAGMRVSDEFRLRWPDFKDGRLYYSMGKNDKGDSLKVPAKAQAILDVYIQFRQNKNDLVFPELRGVDLNNEFITERTIAFKTSAIDKILQKHVAPAAGIDKNLTMHIARHSFAQNAKDVDIRTLQMLFRHNSLQTTEGYMGNFIHKDADDALDKVLDYKAKNSSKVKP
jgi:integrase/recombinase XerD